MLEIRPCADEADKEASLAIYNEVWPEDAVDDGGEVRSFKSRRRPRVRRLPRGEPAAPLAALGPRDPDVGFVLLTVLPSIARQGLGTALYTDGLEHGSPEQGRSELRVDVPVPEDDEESIAFAQRRGFAEVERERPA